MVNIELHRANLIDILREIYSDTILRNILGFKGGTAAMLFYGLPRMSVDLDFDLLDPSKKEEVFQRLKKILPKFGEIIEAGDKRYTLFFLLRYKKGERGLKIDISKRPLRYEYTTKNYLGISMIVVKEPDMIAGKLAALLTRKKFATRDMFDLWFFLKDEWQIDERVLKENTTMNLAEALGRAQEKIKAVQKTEILAGLGELLDNKRKAWAKEKLQDELIFRLKLYQRINRSSREQILTDISVRLRDKYGKEPGIFIDEGKVVLENANEPGASVIPEEVAAIRDDVIRKYHLYSYDLASSVHNGTILIGFSSN